MSEFRPTESTIVVDPNLIIPKDRPKPKEEIISKDRPKPKEEIISKGRLGPDPNFRPNE